MSLINEINNTPKKFERTEKERKLDQQKKIRPKKVTDAAQKASSATGKIQKDTVEISSSGKSILKSSLKVSDYHDYLEQLDNLDKEQLRAVHSRIKENFYDNPEVINKIADTLSESLPEVSAGTIENAEPEQDMVEASAERMNEIRQNIDDGKYNAEDVIDLIVDRMLDPQFF